MTEKLDGIVQALIALGDKYGKTPAQVALAWILDHDEVTAPIIGPDFPEQVEESLGAVGWTLEPEDRILLDEVSAPELPGKYA